VKEGAAAGSVALKETVDAAGKKPAVKQVNLEHMP